MLSRLAVQSGRALQPCVTILARPSQIMAGNTAGVPATKSPLRDEVNFPRPVRPAESPKVRLGFLPDDWFKFFYKKTGVTGPYVFGTGVITFLVSKEIYVLEHEFYLGVGFMLLIYMSVKFLGPKVAAFADKGMAEEEAACEKAYSDALQNLKDAIAAEKQCQTDASNQKILFDAKRENIGLQLEAMYRERLEKVYNEVKKKLDYQVEVNDVKKRVEQKHMVSWIINNVLASITPTQEEAALKQCFSDLKRLAGTA